MQELREIVKLCKGVGVELPKVRQGKLSGGFVIENVFVQDVIGVQDVMIAILAERLKHKYNISWTLKPSNEITDPNFLEEGLLSFTLPSGDHKTLEYAVVEWSDTQDVLSSYWSKGGVNSADPDFVGDQWDTLIEVIWQCFNSCRPYLYDLILDELHRARNYEVCKKYSALNNLDNDTVEEEI